jgi:hypothetical protein
VLFGKVIDALTNAQTNGAAVARSEKWRTHREKSAVNLEPYDIFGISRLESAISILGLMPIRPLKKRERIMAKALQGLSLEVSRRSLLQGAACAAGAATILGVTASRAAAQTKLPQKAVAYQDKPKGDSSCAGCSLFQAPSSCKSVDGQISPQGWCNLWNKA